MVLSLKENDRDNFTFTFTFISLLRLDLSSGLFSQVFRLKFSNTYLISYRATSVAHLILLDLISLIISGAGLNNRAV